VTAFVIDYLLLIIDKNQGQPLSFVIYYLLLIIDYLLLIISLRGKTMGACHSGQSPINGWGTFIWGHHTYY